MTTGTEKVEYFELLPHEFRARLAARPGGTPPAARRDARGTRGGGARSTRLSLYRWSWPPQCRVPGPSKREPHSAGPLLSRTKHDQAVPLYAARRQVEAVRWARPRLEANRFGARVRVDDHHGMVRGSAHHRLHAVHRIGHAALHQAIHQIEIGVHAVVDLLE